MSVPSMQPSINPWSSGQSIDAKKLFEEFGIEPIGPVLQDLPEVPAFMRRGVVIGHRNYGQIATAIREKKPFHVLTGFMPSGHPHLGHLMVMKEVVWHIQQGGRGTITIADCEAHAVRGLSWEDCNRYGREYLQCLYALGFEGRTYFQSKNEVLKNLAFEAATRVNFSDLSAIYGFGSETALAHAMSVINQVADILDPQVEGAPAPTVVPVGIDQDPHIRLTRDVARKLRFFTVEDRGDHVSVRSKNAPAAALEAVHRAYKGSKKYEGHVDIRGIPLTEVKERAREVEIEHGGFGFFTPSATYHQFMPGLQGGKMSSSVPESIIGFHEPEAAVKKKVMGAVTGGRPTLEEQKAMGGEADRCPVYLLNLFHLIKDDRELKELRDRCCGGELTCGACKKETFARVSEFLHDFSERMDAVEHLVEE